MSSQQRRPGSSSQRPGAERLGAEFLCRVKYSNTLPDLPFDGKFLPCPFVSLNRFVEYKPSQLEKEHKFEVLCESDIGIDIDLIDPAIYKITDGEKPPLDPKDEILLDEETNNTTNQRRSMQHSRVVPWMRKTEYISSEFNRFGVAADRQEIKVGYNLKAEQENMYRDHDSQIAAIQKTFEDVKKPVKEHYSKKGVHAVEEFAVLPDFELWRYPFAQVVFDADPSMLNAPEALRVSMMEESQMRGMQDEQGQQFVAVFSPTVETLQKRMEDNENGVPFQPDHVYEYNFNRDYEWNVRNKASKGYEQENYFMVFRGGACYYNELETRVRLNRRRQGGTDRKTMLHVTHVDHTEDEIAQMEDRLQKLMCPYEGGDEDEQEDMEQGEAEKSNASDSDSSRSERSGKGAGGTDSDSDDDAPKKSSAKDSDSDKSDKSDKRSEKSKSSDSSDPDSD